METEYAIFDSLGISSTLLNVTLQQLLPALRKKGNSPNKSVVVVLHMIVRVFKLQRYKKRPP
jgi:hypothetical protein